VADDRGLRGGHVGGDVPARQGDLVEAKVSAKARFWGTLSLVAVFLALEALVVGYRGINPASFMGVQIGALVGFGSLALEMELVQRALRSKSGDVAGATFQTFAMRLVIVAPLTFVFQRMVSGIDGTAFAVSYLVTFFAYLCWLTWKTYHMPVQYKAGRKQFAPRVVDRRETTGCGK
jgi:hypothetical protein